MYALEYYAYVGWVLTTSTHVCSSLLSSSSVHRKDIHFHSYLKKWPYSPNKIHTLLSFIDQHRFLLKTQMAHTTHMNVFYRMDLNIWDQQTLFFWRKRNKWEVETTENRFEVQHGASDGLSKTEMTFQIFWSLPESSRLNFHIQNTAQHREKIDKHLHMYIKSLTSIPFGGPIGNVTVWVCLCFCGNINACC